jgi:arylformamidase
MPPPHPAWLDSQYNNRALVPDHAQHLSAWAEASARVRQQAPAGLDLPYGDQPSARLDVFAPARRRSDSLAPVLVFVHGGYWRSLDKADHSFLAPAFTAHGACVVVPNYALCPAVTIPEIALQMTQALAWVWRHIRDWGGDPGRIVVAGHSAGGHLAAMLLACHWPRVAPDLPPGLVQGALSISGLHDLAPLRHTPFLHDSLRLTPAQVRMASPAGWPAPAQGRLLALVGGDESAEFQRQNRLIQQAWGPERVPVCEALPGLNHFSVLGALAQPQHRLHALARQLLGC